MTGVAIVMIAIALFQVPPLLRRKQWRELTGFALIWFSAAVYTSLVVLDYPLPTILEVIRFAQDTFLTLYKKLPDLF